jgi:Bor protein
MLKKVCLALALVSVLAVSSCYTMNHKVGTGGANATSQDERQWWVLWGLVPINNVDSQTMAGGATNYTVTTEFTVLDVIINFFTSIVTVATQTVTVTK